LEDEEEEEEGHPPSWSCERRCEIIELGRRADLVEAAPPPPLLFYLLFSSISSTSLFSIHTSPTLVHTYTTLTVTMGYDKVDQLAINTIRTLAVSEPPT
jgi:hypothetical protein